MCLGKSIVYKMKKGYVKWISAPFEWGITNDYRYFTGACPQCLSEVSGGCNMKETTTINYTCSECTREFILDLAEKLVNSDQPLDLAST